ncbi:hypothetical protein TNCV_2861721 [Trichonephila clavipes]|nr:hypothetical protein TNCV_2861721 [Trichonephila clavipes]
MPYRTGGRLHKCMHWLSTLRLNRDSSLITASSHSHFSLPKAAGFRMVSLDATRYLEGGNWCRTDSNDVVWEEVAAFMIERSSGAVGLQHEMHQAHSCQTALSIELCHSSSTILTTTSNEYGAARQMGSNASTTQTPSFTRQP